MKHLKDIDIDNKKVLIRVDYNVPIQDNKIINSFRIDSSLKTIQYCLDRGCKVVLMSHLGRPMGPDSKYSLEIVASYISHIFKKNKVYFSSDCISERAFKVTNNLKSSEIHVLENLRFYKEEKDCDLDFSRKLSKHGEIYVNDAFGTAHRSHASNVGVTRFFDIKSYGFLIANELKYFKDSISNDSDIVLLLGGAKISDKIKLLARFGKIAENILIGGAMSNNFLAAKGFSVGKSLIEKDYINLAKEILNNNLDKIHTPIDFVCTKDIAFGSKLRVCSFDSIGPDEITVDIGPRTVLMFSEILKRSKYILWNGPMGIIEKPDFALGTKKMIELIKKETKSGAVSIIGGGDTSSAIENSDFKKFSHISTGGGASLKLLSGELMPALDALN
jgi:3-phosphoglycerate kinase